MNSIGIIGAGVVGVATGMGFLEKGNNVFFYDVSKKKQSMLKSQKLNQEKSIEQLIVKSDITFICVDTPTKNGEQELTNIKSVLLECSKGINKIKNFHLLVLRSTILPGTMKKMVKIMVNNCDKEFGKDYDLIYNPEFLREKNPLDDFRNPDRIIIGSTSEKSIKIILKLYQKFTNNIIITNYENAEMIKYVSNCFLSLKISFFNEIGLICKKMNIDDKIVSKGVAMDKRIGPYGTIFGKPFEGSCLPKDTKAFAHFVNDLNVGPDLLKVILEINENISKIDQELPKTE